MTPAFTDSLTANRLQDFSRQGLQASRPNPFDSLPEKFERRPQSDFALGVDVQSLPGLVVQMIVQQTGFFNGAFAQFGDFGVKVVMTEKKLPSKAAAIKYTKNGILVHHSGKTISSEDVANALAEE